MFEVMFMSGKLSIDKENAIKILEYWFVMEFLNQQSLSNLKKKEQEALKYKTDLKTGNVKRKKVVEDFVRFKCGDNLRTIAKADSKVMQLPIWSNFTVFLGCMKKEICIRKISQHVEWNGQSPDKNYDEIALATLNFSKDGSYISNSLSISPIAWAMKKLSGGTENASQKLSIDNYNSDTRATETKIADLFNSLGNGAVVSEAAESCQILNIVSYDLLLKVENMICSELNIEDKDMRSYLAVYFKLYASENDIEDDDGGVGLHMDFYSKDLEIASDGLRNNRFSKEKEKLLLDYILGINRYNNDLKKPLNRFDIIKPKTEEELFQFMTENLTAAKAPLGKWPSRFMPVLMQQIAVNIATDPDMKLPVFSVNGPPGTGKTTLLKEIIVSNIVEKAILLAEYDNPDDAFDDFPFLYRDDQGNSYNQCYGKYHRLKNKKINRYSILVASSNNTAVENITKELPVEENLLENIKPSKKVCGPNEEALAELTELFTVSKSTEILPFIRKVWKKRANENGEKEKICERVVEEQPDIYFSRLATELLNADVEDKDQKKLQALGLISASLGKKENIEKVEKNVIAPFLDIIGTNEDIEPRKESYLEVRKQFLLQLKLVKDLRKELDKLREKEKAVAEAHEMAGKIEKHAEAQKKKQNFQLSEIDNAIRDHQNIISRLSAEKEALETRIAVIRATYSELEKNINTQQNNIATAQKRIDELNNSISKWEKFIKTKKV